jgi:cobalamin biosynthesis Mg chelatase CobN
MLNKKDKNNQKEKTLPYIKIQQGQDGLRIEINGSGMELSIMLGLMFAENEAIFRIFKVAVEAWEETQKTKEKPFDEQIDTLVEKLEELRNLTRKLH